MIPLWDNLTCKGRPYVTLLLILLNCIGFAMELSLSGGALDQFLMNWALVPSQFMHAFANGDILAIAMALLTIITCSFLHGGWMHIIGNMVFLQAFGRAVEARLGHIQFLAFYLAGCFAAWGLFLFTDHSSSITALGASAPIAAVLGAYFVFYPRAEFKSLILIAVIPLLVIIPAWILLPWWFLLQAFDGVGAILSPANGGGVAYWAHIGGFLFGLGVAGIVACFKPKGNVCYAPISCNCSCGGPCKKGGKHRFQIVRFWRFWKKPDNCDHKH